jgi:hypothetical protein
LTYTRHDLVEKCLATVAERPELPVYVNENSGQRHAGREGFAARYFAAPSVLDPLNLGVAAAFNALVEQSPPHADLALPNPYARLRERLNRTRELLRRPGVAAGAPVTRDDSGPVTAPWDAANRRKICALAAAVGYSDSLYGTRIAHLYARQFRNHEASTDISAAPAGDQPGRPGTSSAASTRSSSSMPKKPTGGLVPMRPAGTFCGADELGVDHGSPMTGKGSHGAGGTQGGNVPAAERAR